MKLNPSSIQGGCVFVGMGSNQVGWYWLETTEITNVRKRGAGSAGFIGFLIVVYFFNPIVICLLPHRKPWGCWEKHCWCLKWDIFGCCSPCDEWTGLGWCGQGNGDSADEIPLKLFSNEILGWEKTAVQCSCSFLWEQVLQELKGLPPFSLKWLAILNVQRSILFLSPDMNF